MMFHLDSFGHLSWVILDCIDCICSHCSLKAQLFWQRERDFITWTAELSSTFLFELVVRFNSTCNSERFVQYSRPVCRKALFSSCQLPFAEFGAPTPTCPEVQDVLAICRLLLNPSDDAASECSCVRACACATMVKDGYRRLPPWNEHSPWK